MVRPIFWSVAKAVDRQTLCTGVKILSDIADNSDGTPAGDIVSRHARDLIGKLKGHGLKRKAKRASPPKKTKRVASTKRPKLTTPKRTYRDIFA